MNRFIGSNCDIRFGVSNDDPPALIPLIDCVLVLAETAYELGSAGDGEPKIIEGDAIGEARFTADVRTLRHLSRLFAAWAGEAEALEDRVRDAIVRDVMESARKSDATEPPTP